MCIEGLSFLDIKVTNHPTEKIIKLIDDSDDEGSEIEVTDNKIVMNL